MRGSSTSNGTGYEFAAILNNLFVDTANDRAFDDIYARFIGEQRRRLSFDDLVYRSKKLVMHETMSGDINSLGHQLNRLSERHRHFRCVEWPAGLSATSTHDTKRGEDVRARLNILSEMPAAWKSAVAKWRALNHRFKREVHGAAAPSPNEEYFIYQMLVGAWPFDTQAVPAFRERLGAYFTNALREAKVNTSWLSPDEEYEAAVLRFVDVIVDERRPFLRAFLPFQAHIAELGIYNSLAQLLIKIAAPRIPDFYQGTELWDLSLVDPDNRRPVDYALRGRLLDEIDRSHESSDEGLVSALLDPRTDGRVKLFAMTRALRTRARMRHVLEEGHCVPIEVSGSRRECLFVFARRHENDLAIACMRRMVASLVPDADRPPLGRALWGDTRIQLPPAIDVRAHCDVFTGGAFWRRTPTAAGPSKPRRFWNGFPSRSWSRYLSRLVPNPSAHSLASSPEPPWNT